MDEEVSGLHIVFVCILLCILFFTYHAIPSDTLVHKKHKVSYTTNSKTNKTINDSTNVSIEELNPSQTKPIADNGLKDSEAVVANTHLKDDQNLNQTKGNNSDSSKDVSVISMNNPGYKSHKRGIVVFTHEKHISDYKIDCQACHHDENGAPLKLTLQDKVQGCIECHPGTIKPQGEKLDKKLKIMKYHFEALHANCITCHKTYNIEKGDAKGKGPAPVSCSKCHLKKK